MHDHGGSGGGDDRANWIKIAIAALAALFSALRGWRSERVARAPTLDELVRALEKDVGLHASRLQAIEESLHSFQTERPTLISKEGLEFKSLILQEIAELRGREREITEELGRLRERVDQPQGRPPSRR
jgi:hypothetical protein